MSDTAVAAALPPALSEQPRLIDRDDLVDDSEGQRVPKPVPNYFLDTKIFNKIGRNAIVEAQPSSIHFGGFTPNQVHVRKVKFANVSTEVTRFHILPPETPFFKLTYQKQDRLVPGFAVECVLEFKPTEVRYYYDALRVHSKDEENNLVVPIHAYPVLGHGDFPRQVKFPAIPVGHRKTRVLPLRSRAPVEFEFEIRIVHSNPVFTVAPLEGTIPANGEVDVAVTFAPKDFVTAEMTLELRVSQFNFRPLRCHVMGHSAPGMQRHQVLAAYGVADVADPGQLAALQPPPAPPADPSSFSPLERARSKKRMAAGQQQQQQQQQQEFVEMNGLRIPTRLDCPHAVARVLNQRQGRLNMRELREALEQSASGLAASRQMKEAVFEQEVARDVYEERQNQLRWQVKLGDLPLGDEEAESLLMQRQMAWEFYRRKRGDPDAAEEQQRTATEVAMRRTRRVAQQLPDCSADFDLYKNDRWESRWTARFRFVQAAWKIVVRRRADEKLAGLRQLLIDWGKGKYAAFTTTASYVPFLSDIERKEEDEEIAEDLLKDSQLSAASVGTVTFPTHQTAQQIKKMEEAAPPTFPSLTDRLVTRRQYQFEQLQVPLQYQLQHYERLDVHSMSRSHVPATAPRALRQGAVEEIVDLPLASVAKEDGEVAELGEVEQESEEAEVPLVLKPPAALFQAPQYHPLHVFNPAPGMRVFDQPPPYLETDTDGRLCPLPRYAARAFLDARDVVRGVTTWKKFASPGLAALGNTPTLTRVWVPRWSDPFQSELAPAELPKFLDGLDAEDASHVLEEQQLEEEEEEGEEEEGLTPEMVWQEFLAREPSETEEQATAKQPADSEEFPFGQRMPDTNVPLAAGGLAPRWRREKELEFFLVNRANRVGKRVAERRSRMRSQLADPGLALS